MNVLMAATLACCGVAQADSLVRLSGERGDTVAAAQFGQREVRCPFSGLVVARHRMEGARVAPLRVDAIVPAKQFGAFSARRRATVKTDLPDFASLNATVKLVGRVLDLASNTCRVRLALVKPGHKIQASLRVGQLSSDPAKQPWPRSMPSAWDVGATKEATADAKAGSAGTEPLLIKPAQPARLGPSPEMPAPPMQAQAPRMCRRPCASPWSGGAA